MKVIFITKDYVIEPLGIAYLSSAIKKAGYPTSIIKTEKEPIVGAIKHEIKGFNRVVFAYSLTTGSQNYYLHLNHALKRLYPKAISVFGGPHVTYFPEIIKEWGVDHIIRGEAEIAFPEMLREIEAKGTCVKDYGLGRLITNLDDAPFPDRELIYKYAENRDNPIKNIITSRGCPYSCPYCYNSLYRQIYHGEKVLRYRSPENVIAECKELVSKYVTKVIYFEDDEFLMNPRFKKLMELYKREIKVPFHCQIRIEHLDMEKLQLLKKAGCNGVTFAVESGNDIIRHGLLKRNVHTEAIIHGAQLLRREKMKFRTQNMCGLPYETTDMIMDTVRLNQKLKATVPWMSIFQPYPNLPLGDIAYKEGLWDGSIDAFAVDFFDKTVLNIPNAREVNNIQKLFSLVVKHPILTPLVRLLIKLPENKVFKWFYKWHKNKLYKELYGI